MKATWNPKGINLKRVTKVNLEVGKSEQIPEEHTLVASAWHGRFALDAENGPNLSCGQSMSILICGQWIDGLVQHDFVYVTQRGPASGYFLECPDGTCIGLCAGMRVRA